MARGIHRLESRACRAELTRKPRRGATPKSYVAPNLGRSRGRNPQPTVENKTMNPPLTTLDPITSPSNMRRILAKDGFHCSIITLSPGDETPPREAQDVEENVLFTIEGEATVRLGDLNMMLKKDDAVLIQKGQAHVIAAGPNSWARILRVDVPPRQVVTPQILTIDG